MPRAITNVFQPNTQIGRAVQEFAGALFGNHNQPQLDPTDAAQIAANQALAENRRAETAALEREASALQGISDVFGNIMPQVEERRGTFGPFPADQPQTVEAFQQDALERALRDSTRIGIAGGLEPDDIGGAISQLLNAFGGTDADLVRLQGSLGNFIGENQGVSIPDRENVRQANAENSIAEALAKIAAEPLTKSQFEAQILQGLSDDDQRTAALGSQAFGSPLEKVADEGSPSGVTLVPRADAAGQPGVAPGAASRSDVFPTAVRSEAISTLNNASTTRETIAQLRELAADPTNFGAVGFLREAVQDAAQQGSAFAQALGLNGQSVQKQIQETATDLAVVGDQPVPLGHFDPNLPQLEFATNLLAYQLAFINSPDGRVSNQDFNIARQTIGGGGPLANREDFLSRLEVMERLIDSRERAARSVLGDGAPGSPAIAAQSGAPSAPRPGPGDTVIEFDAQGRRISR